MESSTFGLLSYVLNASVLQHEIAVSNLANSHTENHIPRTLDWERVLSDIESRYRAGELSHDSARPLESYVDVGMPGDAIKMETLVSEMLKNNLRQQAVITVFNRLHAIERLAISGRSS